MNPKPKTMNEDTITRRQARYGDATIADNQEEPPETLEEDPKKQSSSPPFRTGKVDIRK